MSEAMSKGPFCQSCGMPLEKPEDFGTAASGFRINDYCCWCYAGGAFTEPDISMEQMIDKCVAIMNEHGIMPEAQARSLMTQVMPELKRWKKSD
jgi:hypothetical protein